jgi:hypothetical protein
VKPLVKIPRSLLIAALNDLERPHPFAGERVGFFSFRQSMHATRPLLICVAYHPVPDAQYVPDRSCGARINGEAIRAAMGRSFRDKAGELWVHTHGRHGTPSASSTDVVEGPNVVTSLANAQWETCQGWAVISEQGIGGQVRMPAGAVHQLAELGVIGWPLVLPPREQPSSLLGRLRRRITHSERYARQSFLGLDAQRLFRSAKIGVIGLGGGGSHINQQLAHIGFQNAVLCDADKAEMSNLNRLVGATLQDVKKKRYKTRIASRLFRKLQPQACIDDEPLPWEEKRERLRECDLIFGCMDSFSGRRDLEAFCRLLMIPLIDIGMTVHRSDGVPPEIYGQAILSMPGGPCMNCLQLLTPENLGFEAQDYNAGPQPQVIWPNGVLASTAIGYAIGLLTGWSGPPAPCCRIDHRGSRLTLNPSNLALAMGSHACLHYPLANAGDPIYTKL